MEIRHARLADIPAITEIYNDAVVNSMAIWNDVVVDNDNREKWAQEKAERGFPLLVAATDRVLGYATYGDFRPFDGYRHTVENSIYISAHARGQGIGGALLDALLAQAAGKVHVMVAAIEASNEASIKLHLSRGFDTVGLMPQVGQKFGKWLDLALFQKEIPV